MDRYLKKRGFRRNYSETLHQFGVRIASEGCDSDALREVAAWYTAYAVLRYAHRPDEQSVGRLRDHQNAVMEAATTSRYKPEH